MEHKLSKQIYHFERQFHYLTGELDNIDKVIKLQIDLTIDLLEDKFWIDFNNSFNVDTGILLMYGQNLIGNTYNKAKASKEFYEWVAEICEFAGQELDKASGSYDIMKNKIRQEKICSQSRQ